MTQFVVDANVAIKWVVPEIHSAAALRLRNPNYTLLVPDFFFPEIGNILWKRVRRGETTLEYAQEDLGALMGLGLQIIPSLPLMPQAIEVAVRIQQAVYDCVYLTLAAGGLFMPPCTSESGHGREEIRHYLMLSNMALLVDPTQKWSNLKSVGMVESVRTVNGKTTVETRYYISSLDNNAKLLGQSVRSHWGIENSLHWILDVGFSEDDCRIRKDNAPQNFAVLRHIALNLLGKEKSKKFGIKNKQFLAAMDDNYLAKILDLNL